ncbi:hypothetical protein [Desulfosarcina cetonica]|uniref:hypothetical protein n=1 Tax=Desulfosarcina cetonica TaxID=90730 RepID=UPI001FED2F90|nr:hypothetical protein [Desulfosarcina cetonica]
MPHLIPEKAELLEKLRQGGFAVPDFIYVPSQHFDSENFTALEAFLEKHRESFKVIARSAHPQERHFKGGPSIHWKPTRMWAAFVMHATR